MVSILQLAIWSASLYKNERGLLKDKPGKALSPTLLKVGLHGYLPRPMWEGFLTCVRSLNLLMINVDKKVTWIPFLLLHTCSLYSYIHYGTYTRFIFPTHARYTIYISCSSTCSSSTIYNHVKITASITMHFSSSCLVNSNV